LLSDTELTPRARIAGGAGHRIISKEPKAI
jgi:hypothetical protein